MPLRCSKAIKKLIGVLKTKKSRRVLLAIDLIETCSKNGKTLFHKKICTQEFMNTLLKQLKYVFFYCSLYSVKANLSCSDHLYL